MNIFYAPTGHLGETVTLGENETQHLHVLRMTVGSYIAVMNGKGFMFRALLQNLGKREAEVQLLEILRQANSPSPLHIAIAPTKNIERMMWFVEKVTEIGVGLITPLLCERSERKDIRPDRLQKVILSAAKQAQQLFLPTLMPMIPFKKMVMNSQEEVKLMAHCNGLTQPMQKFVSPLKTTLVLIGPEGDFTQQEIALATEKNFALISLGHSRLRTETAGVVAATIFQSYGA